MSGDLSRGETARTIDHSGVIRTLVSLYSSWTTLVTNGVLFAIYYLVFYELIVRSNSGFFLLTIPVSLLVLLVLASSALATVAMSYFRLSFRRRSLPGIAESPIGVVVGAFVATCSCNLPLLAPVMYFFGLNAVEVSGVISFLAAYQEIIVEAIVIIDALSIYYYLRLISGSGSLGRSHTASRRDAAPSSSPEPSGKAAPSVNNTVRIIR